MGSSPTSSAKWRVPLGWLATGVEYQGIIIGKGSTPSLSANKGIIMSSLVERAEYIARRVHDGQFRKYTREPYFLHVYNVARRVAKIDNRPELIAAAFLHDSVEDTDLTIEEVGEMFGLEVAELVYDLTDHFTKENYPNMNRAKRKSLEAVRLGTISNDAKLIKLCDLADNTSSIVEHDPGFAKIYLKEKADILEAMGY